MGMFNNPLSIIDPTGMVGVSAQYRNAEEQEAAEREEAFWASMDSDDDDESQETTNSTTNTDSKVQNPPTKDEIKQAVAVLPALQLVRFLQMAIAAGASVEVIKELSAKRDKEIARIRTKPPGRDGEMYSLRAEWSGMYPSVRGGEVWLNKGDVWKYGETTNPDSRYGAKYLYKMGLRYQTETTGTQVQVKVAEKFAIYGYFFSNGSLPPGNSIFR